MKSNYLILDCFVDEPACFGVPPFFSPYPRYIYGALVDGGIEPDRIAYRTIDGIRASNYRIDAPADRVFLIGGAVVPGKYLGARIGTAAEIEKIIAANKNLQFILGGMIRFMLPEMPNATRLSGDIEAYAHGLARGEPADRMRSTAEIARWAALGAPVVQSHPDHPVLVCEIETYRGCPRTMHCSFCSEGLMPFAGFRGIPDILNEIDSLIGCGISRFRLGRQADILQYGSGFTDYRGGFPRPQPGPVSELFGELKKRKVSGSISLLNIDNANPGTIANFPDESAEILGIITRAVTPGDTMALGVESFDEKVVALNGLKVGPAGARTAIEIINSAGARRVDGIPVLLPGINLVHGLRGEDEGTFEKNYRCLMEILEAGLLVKRINIRKALPFPGTPLCENPPSLSRAAKNRFEYYRDRIRHDVDIPMLKRIYPAGTVLQDVRMIEHRSGYSLGKQVASYSITVKVPGALELNGFCDLVAVGHQERSLVGLEIPVRINTIGKNALEAIPGISKKRASDIVLARPFSDHTAALEALRGVDEGILKHVQI